jgi:23S rRNA (adenine2503-C2)-methyltransferase
LKSVNPMQSIQDIRDHLRALGANALHEQRVLRLWVQAKPQDSGRRPLESFMPKTLRDALPRLSAHLAGLATLREQHPGQDGSARLLVGLQDGQTVESVLLPRDGLCVSSKWAVPRSWRKWRWRARSGP